MWQYDYSQGNHRLFLKYSSFFHSLSCLLFLSYSEHTFRKPRLAIIMSNFVRMYGSQWGSLGAACKRDFFPSFTTSRVRICIRYCKSCSEIEALYDKIIIAIVPSYTGKKNHKFAAIDIVTHHSTKLYQKI